MDNNNRKPRCVVISGIDGSGKTTVIDLLQCELKGQGWLTAYIWLRFNHYFTKIMHAIARMVGLSVKVHSEMGDTWQHRFYQSSIFCNLYIITTYIDTCISRVKYNRVAKGHDIVICDRWITDIIVDLATKTHRANLIDGKWAKRFLKILPEDAVLFVIYRETQAIVDCRLENRVDPDFKFRLAVYKQLLEKSFIHPVDNRGTLSDTLFQIRKVLNI
ncbi:thymidylate kinase [Coprobacter fastidiosus]|jgi:thymidylate kinase|uniref:thymidylate kinase n=1 Tax=Coprobacter fastidiosus TaxID=1099853 RepID=UPI0026DB5EE2|nr:thymidylate kinase [Coprobacter fastidiosus]